VRGTLALFWAWLIFLVGALTYFMVVGALHK
jgi:hypothetical protein